MNYASLSTEGVIFFWKTAKLFGVKTQRGAILCLALSLAGLCVTAYLTFIHLALLRGELYGGPICGGGDSFFNCHAVTDSKFASFLGIPLSLWGVLSYLVTLALAFIAWRIPRSAGQALTAIVGLSGAYLLVDLFLLGVMVLQIHALCPLCLMTDLINLFLLLSAKEGLSRPWKEVVRQVPEACKAFLPGRGGAPAGLLWGILGTGFLGILAVHASSQRVSQTPGSLQGEIVQRLRAGARVKVEAAGSPRVGSPNAPVQLVMFMDFLCPTCQRAAQHNTVALAAHPRDLSLVVKQFPLDRACNTAIPSSTHPGSCRLAAAAACAHEQGKFGPFHERLIQRGLPYDLSKLADDAAAAGLDLEGFQACMESGRGETQVEKDVAEGKRLGVTGTPTFFINGAKFVGAITPDQFKELIQEEERRKR